MRLFEYAPECVVVVLIAVSLTQASVDTPQKASGTPMTDRIKEVFSNGDFNIVCMIEKCFTEAVSCVKDQRCRDAIVCDKKCMDEWDNDTTKGKFHIQNCSNVCAWTYVDDIYQSFIRCVTSNQCLKLPPIANTCRAPNIHPLKQLSVKDLEGDWWVVKGLHPVYDCYPCQKIYFKAINEATWNYSSYYQVYLANGSLSLAYLQTVVPTNVPGSNMSFVYDDIGMNHYETWWLIDKADDSSYILLYYCGHTLQWNYEGAQVLARNTTLDATSYTHIASSYEQAVGLNITEFSCNTGTQNCPESHVVTMPKLGIV